MALSSRLIDARILGPYYSKKAGRYIVNLEFRNGHRSSMTLARFLFQEHLGRILSVDEHVDHIDENRLNDVLENFQILTPSANTRKTNGEITWFQFNCPECGKLAQKNARFVRHNHNQGKPGPFCGRSCAGRFNANTRWAS